jgi:hypothetical protein
VADAAEPVRPGLLWLASAVGTAWATALCGWIVLTGLTVLGWLAGDSGTFSQAMRVGSQLWLLANGAGARLGSTAVTLVPWAATVGVAVVLHRWAGFAARQSDRSPLAASLTVTAAMTAAYAVPVLGAALLLNGTASLRQLLPVLALLALAAWWGACRGLGYRPTRSWPAWCRSLPRAVVGAQLALLAAGVGALATGLVLHAHRVVALTDSLHAGVVGGIAVSLVQLAFLPNAVLWAASYALGAGFTLGPGSVVSLTETSHGVLPSIPVLAALPAAGPGSSTHLWWLAAGVLAGGVAAWIVVRGRPAARCDETALVGGLSGLLAGLVFVALGWAGSGDLGMLRLSGLGPRLVPLLVLAPTSLGLAGLLVGLLLGLARRSPR